MKHYTSAIFLSILLAFMAASIGYEVGEATGIPGGTVAIIFIAIVALGGLLTLTQRGDSARPLNTER